MITSSDDIIDSRDIVARIAELEAADCDGDDPRSGPDGEGCDEVDLCPTCYGEAGEELAALKALDETSSPDWQYGATLIRESYFEEYAQQYAEDIGAVASDAPWPVYCIDWQQAADDLQMDYTSVEFDGVTYWVR